MKNIKVLFIGDTHADEKAPESRKDNYLETCVSKLRESFHVAQDRKCDYIVHLGDIFHKREPSGVCRNSILEVFQHDENGQPWNIPIYIVVGNHDIQHNIQNLPNSALGTLIEAGIINYVDEIPEFKIGFQHFRSSIEEELENGALQKQNNIIYACHANITKENFFGNFVLFDNVPVNPECKLVVAGHIHFPIEVKRKNRPLFINPGSLVRNAMTDFNIARMPQLLFVEYSLDGSIFKTEYIPIKYAADAKQIFKVEENQIKKLESDDTSKYIQKINQMKIITSEADKYDSLRESGKIQKLDQRIIDLAVSKLSEVNEESK